MYYVACYTAPDFTTPMFHMGFAHIRFGLMNVHSRYAAKTQSAASGNKIMLSKLDTFID